MERRGRAQTERERGFGKKRREAKEGFRKVGGKREGFEKKRGRGGEWREKRSNSGKNMVVMRKQIRVNYTKKTRESKKERMWRKMRKVRGKVERKNGEGSAKAFSGKAGDTELSRFFFDFLLSFPSTKL